MMAPQKAQPKAVRKHDSGPMILIFTRTSMTKQRTNRTMHRQAMKTTKISRHPLILLLSLLIIMTTETMTSTRSMSETTIIQGVAAAAPRAATAMAMRKMATVTM
jgi:hypothetical protein